MDEEVRKRLEPWQQEFLRIMDEVQKEAGGTDKQKRTRKVSSRSSSALVECDEHKGLRMNYDSELFRKCPICSRDRIIDEYEEAVKAFYDLQELDFQLIQIIFDTYDNNGIREERNRRRDEIIGKWKEREGEVMSRLRTVRDCYVETFQGSLPKA